MARMSKRGGYTWSISATRSDPWKRPPVALLRAWAARTGKETHGRRHAPVSLAADLDIQQRPMALKSTVYKADLQVSDMDRHYYQNHALTIAQHPSETDERMMVRVLAFALNADDALAFGKGLSSDDEPDLWRKELTGEVDLWIELGQPDEQRIRRAAGRARRVIIYTYSGRGAEVWWKKMSQAVGRTKNVSVVDVDPVTVEALAALTQRTMQLQFMVQDGEAQVISGDAIVPIVLTPLA